MSILFVTKAILEARILLEGSESWELLRFEHILVRVKQERTNGLWRQAQKATFFSHLHVDNLRTRYHWRRVSLYYIHARP
jgi:hypothetical protein